MRITWRASGSATAIAPPASTFISFSCGAVEGAGVVRSPSAGSGRSARYTLLVGATAGELAILHAPRHSTSSVLLVIGTGSLAGLLVVLEHRRSRLALAPVVLAIGIVLAASVWTPPRTSNDLWSYTMYGRMVTVYDKSPYEHTPVEFRPDPFVRRVSPRWLHRASVYGPLFVGVAALDAFVAGPSPLVARVFFQLLAALALAAILVVVWRTTRHLGAVIFLGLNPVLAVVVVNGGHNDVLIGLALMLATLLAFRRRAGAAGALVGMAALIKLTAGLALVGLVVWAWRHELRKFAAVLVGTTMLVFLAGYLPVLASASHVLGASDKTVTNGSPWNWLVDRLLRHDAWRNVPRPLAPNGTLIAFFYVGTATIVLIAVALAWSAGTRGKPDVSVGVAVAAYPVGAEYAYPWYTAWALPLFATDGLTVLSAVVWVESVAMLAALKLPLLARGPALQSVLRIVLTDVTPPVLLVAFVVVALRESTLVRRVPALTWSRGPARLAPEESRVNG